jgi:hypothetical protein
VTTASIPVELWAPFQPIPTLLHDLSAARLEPVLLPEPDRTGTLPLLVVYPHPAQLPACLDAWQGSGLPAAAQLYPQLALLADLERSGRPWRLVNGGCLSVPTLVAWCVEPHRNAPPTPWAPRFLPVEPLAALLARELIGEHPDWLEAYRQLEHHPRAAVLDGRPADDRCLESLAQAWDGPAALRTWQEQRRLQHYLTDLLEAGERLAALELENDQLQSLREQLIQREATLAQLQRERETERTTCDQLLQEQGRRCEELSCSLAAADQDREALIRRLELLEGLVARTATASRGMQELLPRLLP